LAFALAAGSEEVGEEGAALFGEEGGGDFDFVVELGMVHDGEDRAAGAGFGVGRGVDEATDAGVEDGSGAHGAGLEGGVEGAVFEAIVSECATGFAEGDDLGVCGWVGVAEDSVLAAADDFVFVDNDCAYGDFAVGFGVVGFGDGGAEVVEVFHLLAPLAGLRVGSGAEEADDLLSDSFEGRAAKGKFSVVINEILAPNCFEYRQQFADGYLVGLKIGD
jgi:hypothetical protein